NGPIEQVEFVTLWYMSQAENFTQQQRLQALEMRLFELSRADNFSDLISFDIYGDQIANSEMLRGTFHTVKLFALGVVLMIIFIAIAFNHIAWKFQPILIIGAVGSPAIATATTFAILGWIDFPFNSIMCITPFLVMGIGVDDAFLLLHSWRTHSSLPAKDRMRMVVHEIGPSMAITSITNTLAFGIGIASPTPQMSGFCLCTSLAIFLDFVFEFLVFGPLMVLFYSEREEKPKGVNSFFSWEKYTKVLLSPVVRFAVVAITLTIYVSAFFGVSQMKPSFDPSKTFPSDSDLMVSLTKFEKVQSEYSVVNFISLLPPLSEKATFFEMVGRLEHSEGCYGPERTQLMIRYFLDWAQTENITNLTYQDLPRFLANRKINDSATIRSYENYSALLGFLGLWGQDLDPVTMINVLMAIGFSVDFSAHVCYHYHMSLREGVLLSDTERITKILQAVGKPIFEVMLAAFLANNCALGTFPQLDTKTRTVLNLTEVNSTFTKLNEEWMYKLIWDENITRDALLEAIQQHIATADFKIRGKKAFMKSLKNETTMAQKVEEALVFPFVRAHKFVSCNYRK
ncbi:SSD domain-containing protein, partial [Trichostrongylus colubriformis]